MASNRARVRGQAQRTPNVLLIMCDQLNASVMSCYGGPIPMANLDQLATQGVVFRQATCPYPVCSPSRASLVTGLYPRRHGILHNVNRREYPAWYAHLGSPETEEGLKSEDITTESLLYQAGYQTHHYGKWHLLDEDLPYYRVMYREQGEYAAEMADTFARVRATYPREAWMDWYGWALPVAISPALKEANARLGNRWADEPYAEFFQKVGRLLLPVKQTFDFRVADHAVARLRSLDAGPFMLTCSFNSPHDPQVIPSPYYEAFQPEAIEFPASFDHREPMCEGLLARRIVTDLGEEAAREFLHVYYACCLFADDQIGRVLRALEATGRAEETIVIFTADHGDLAGGHGMLLKGAGFYDELVRVPLIIRYPRGLSPGRTDLNCSLVDLMPTLLAMTGQPIPKHVQGTDLSPWLLGCATSRKPPGYSYGDMTQRHPGYRRCVEPGRPGSFMVRSQEHKYARYANGTEWLFDLARDPMETVNLASDPAHADQRRNLGQHLADWLRETFALA